MRRQYRVRQKATPPLPENGSTDQVIAMLQLVHHLEERIWAAYGDQIITAAASATRQSMRDEHNIPF